MTAAPTESTATESAATESAPAVDVLDVLRAIDRASLLALAPPEVGRMLAAPVARAAAGITLPLDDQRAAARLLRSAADELGPVLRHMGLDIPPVPDPVARRETRSATADKVPLAKLVDGGQRIGVKNLFTLGPVVKALPGALPCRRGDWGVYTVPATPAGAHALAEALAPYAPRFSAGVIELARAHREAADARAYLADGAPLPEVDPEVHGLSMDLWTHQQRAVAYGEATRASLFAIPMGGGKTAATIALVNRVKAATVLIVCPNRVRRVWPREVRERSRVNWHIEDGTRPARRRGAKRQDLKHPERLDRCQRVLWDCDCGAPVHAFVLNYEALNQDVWQAWEPPDKIDIIVYDEAHRLKNPETKVKLRRKKGDHERALGPDATDEDVREARRLDAIGPREAQLLAAGITSGAEWKHARLLDKVDRRNDEIRRSSKLTMSGVAARWVQWSHRRVALSGTPFPQHPWDIFGLYRALEPGVFGLAWPEFADRFVQMDRAGKFPVRIAKGKLAEFSRLAMSLMYRPKVDLRLPGYTDVVREVDLEPAARKLYDDLDTRMRTDLAAFLDGGGALGEIHDDGGEPDVEPVDPHRTTKLTAKNVLSRLLRLQQLTGGTLRTDPELDATGRLIEGEAARVSRTKADELAEFDGDTIVGGVLDEIGCVPGRKGPDGRPIEPEPLIVFCRFKSDLDAVEEIARRAGLRYREVSGRRGDGLDDDARMNPTVDIVGVQIQAGGTGVDLTRARYAVWYSLGYSVSDYDQARARPYRPGQTRPVVFIHLIARDTADQDVYDAIKARKDAVAEVLRASGIDPSDLGYVPENIGADPTAAPIEGQGGAGAAVPLPWEDR